MFENIFLCLILLQWNGLIFLHPLLTVCVCDVTEILMLKCLGMTWEAVSTFAILSQQVFFARVAKWKEIVENGVLDNCWGFTVKYSIYPHWEKNGHVHESPFEVKRLAKVFLSNTVDVLQEIVLRFWRNNDAACCHWTLPLYSPAAPHSQIEGQQKQ